MFENQNFNFFKSAGTMENVEWSQLDQDLIARYIYLVEKHEIGFTSMVTKITETGILANSI